MNLVNSHITNRNNVDILFDILDDVLWRGWLRLTNEPVACYEFSATTEMLLLISAIIPHLVSNGVDRVTVLKHLDSITPYIPIRTKRNITLWYQYIAGRIFMLNIPYCFDVPSLHYFHTRNTFPVRRAFCIHEPFVMADWQAAVLAAIGKSGDLFALPPCI
jgi:hypothetical protein